MMSDDTDEETLIKSADMAMYLAKEEGKNDFRFFSNDMKPHRPVRPERPERSQRRDDSAVAGRTPHAIPILPCRKQIGHGDNMICLHRAVACL